MSYARNVGKLRRLRVWIGRIILCAVALSFLIIAGKAALSWSGFCFATRQYLSEQDYFTAAIEKIIARKQHSLILSRERELGFQLVPVVAYTSIDEFRSVNPDCCKIVPHNTGDLGPYTSWLDRISGSAARIVSITYVLRYLDKTGERHSTVVTTQYAVTNCGRAWNARH